MLSNSGMGQCIRSGCVAVQRITVAPQMLVKKLIALLNRAIKR